MASRRPPAPTRLAKIRETLLRIEDLCHGSLVQRRTRCGKPACRCASNPEALHGPYWVWSRLEDKRLVQTRLTPAQANRMRRAIKNERRARELLARWGRETAKAILADRDPTG